MIGNAHAATGAGIHRQPYRIREFLDARGLSMTDVARQVGVSPQAVAATVRGRRNHRKVLKALLEMGCPADVLSLPADLQQRSVA
ncbi:helix-turn-helix domain-containing protein [Oleidesulfovibrio alaskensis]|jgi:transcriptional regulator with XRE-family HTH domain|uniref:helix-turn-helix domain-containing protein n=1 Tax=Oleidesulfovibrio alaskensis TaxID=58180 RepID=UPI00048318D7|nr:helix-turn-helix transcriptional regulator [Oleidesulfovibrio alaskensis]